MGGYSVCRSTIESMYAPTFIPNSSISPVTRHKVVERGNFKIVSLPVYHHGIPPQLSYQHPHPSLLPSSPSRSLNLLLLNVLGPNILPLPLLPINPISPHTPTNPPPLSFSLSTPKTKTHPTINIIPNPISRLIEQSTQHISFPLLAQDRRGGGAEQTSQKQKHPQKHFRRKRSFGGRLRCRLIVRAVVIVVGEYNS